MISMLTNPTVSSLPSLSWTPASLPADYAPPPTGSAAAPLTPQHCLPWASVWCLCPSLSVVLASERTLCSPSRLHLHPGFLSELLTLVPVHITPVLRNPPRVALRGLFQSHVSEHSADISTCMNDQELNLPPLQPPPGLRCFPPQ